MDLKKEIDLPSITKSIFEKIKKIFKRKEKPLKIEEPVNTTYLTLAVEDSRIKASRIPTAFYSVGGPPDFHLKYTNSNLYYSKIGPFYTYTSSSYADRVSGSYSIPFTGKNPYDDTKKTDT